MNNKEILKKKIIEYGINEKWNHYYKFKYGLETLHELPNSPGNNINKWGRLKPILNKIKLENKKVIDVGCSDGYYSNECAKLGAKSVLGIDLDSLRVQRAKFASEILGIKNVKFRNIDIYGEELSNIKFDIVLALGMLHRISDIFGFIKKLTELGNIIIIEFKTLNSKEPLCKWAGAITKGNNYNKLFFLPTISMVTDILEFFNFNTEEIHKDNSQLKYKRTIIVAKRKHKNKNIIFKNYKDKHKGERVFLIGNGPSLAKTNLNLLKNEKTIAMNRISLIYDKNKNWKPTYYLFSSTNVKDKNWGKEWLSSVREAISKPETTSFIASDFKTYIDPDGEYKKVNWFYSLTETKPNHKGEVIDEVFSTDIVERIDKSGTSMNIALQLAYYMGFAEIVFIGVDLGWTKDYGSKNDPNHFDKNYRANIENPYKANQQMRNIHKLAYSVFNKNKPNIKMYNASLKTVLDIYPIIEFEAYVKNNKIIERADDMKLANLFWKKQVYIPPKVNIKIKMIISKIKKFVFSLVKK